MVPSDSRPTSSGAPPARRVESSQVAPRSRPRVPLLLLLAWGFLFVNATAFGGGGVMDIPRSVGQLLTQGSLGLALVCALAINRRGLVRPNLFLILLTMLAVLAVMVSLHNEFFLGSTYRASRFLLFVGVLWLLTPWWGRRDMLLLRCHRHILWAALSTVFLGAAVAPGAAFSLEGRLAGVLWVIPPTGVAHVAAILFGTSVVLWMCRVIATRHASLALVVSGAAMVMTHTRTAVVATALGLVVATASLFLGHVRARRVSAFTAASLVVAAMFFASGLTTWALRGQSAEQLSQLTGRTNVWSAVLAGPRPPMEQLFGSGMSDQSFNGLPIDSSWVSKYVDQGLVGVLLVTVLLLLLLVMAVTRERGPERAAALFLVVYCMVASVTEAGVGAVTTYQLDLAVAAALLARRNGGDR